MEPSLHATKVQPLEAVAEHRFVLPIRKVPPPDALPALAGSAATVMFAMGWVTVRVAGALTVAPCRLATLTV